MAQPANATNNFDPAVVQPLVGKIDDYFSDLESERGSYMQRCRTIRESIQGVYEEAKARGIPVPEFKTFIKTRARIAKARQLIEDLERDSRVTVEMLAEAFGDAADLPIFKFQMDRAQEVEQPRAEPVAEQMQAAV